MRKIIVSNLISLDGYFEGINQDISWFKVNEDFFAYARQQLFDTDIILFGRITYQMMAAYWSNTKDDDAVITEQMNSHNKIVFSKTLEGAEWNNTKLIKENVFDEVTGLKQQPGKDMLILGSGTLVSTFTQMKLIDEYRLIVSPVILGNGNPLFKNLNEKFDLALTASKVLSDGLVILYYKPA